MKSSAIDWSIEIKPLLKKYKNKKHPLDAANSYQWIVMVVLSAQATDSLINQLAPDFFKTYPDIKALSKADPKSLFPLISKVRNFAHKAQWLVNMAKEIKTDSNIPLDMESLVELPGIGRKSANVIRRGAKASPQGIIVDLHTIRVSNRLGIVTTDNAEKIEKQLMELLPEKEWDAGMAMSFLGREICHPEPECPICLMKKVCAYYNGEKVVSAVKKKKGSRL
ncbi:DNA lyase [Niastella yeongjuensis]|uniref:DNA lyase n=1 Tax=Niastella yeongjuensis TaxID=354355 RepID=A0A1V9ES31_9BACT|nr:DNA lyase [Niastella yeongjuensis]OQP48957.1 DNA lyase [Niastella yeongjuensis]SEP08934.1 endonuclease-3 [Niastella yeongjuensis]